MPYRIFAAIAATVAVALSVGSCLPSGLSDAERVWCNDRTVTVAAAADALNIGPEPKGRVDGPDTLSQWSYRKASLDRDWVRACKAAYEVR
ncbi:MAG: hypothetical protein V3S62_02580 [Acidimicrobiia bacterium]